jgi:hypothetical protein
MSEWTFSFTMPIGTGATTDTGIEPEATTGHGKISEAAECPMRCAIYVLIFATPCDIINGFDTLTSRGTGRDGSTRDTGTDTIIGTRGTGRSGSTRDTGTDTIIGARYEVATTVGDGKTTIARPIVDTRYETLVMTRSGKEIRAVSEGE